MFLQCVKKERTRDSTYTSPTNKQELAEKNRWRASWRSVHGTRNSRFKREQQRKSMCSCAWTRERARKSRCHTNSSLATVERSPSLSLHRERSERNEQGLRSGRSRRIRRGPPPVRGRGNSASVWCGVCTSAAGSPSPGRAHASEDDGNGGLCKQEQEAKELKASRFFFSSSLSSGCSPLGSSARTNDFVMHCLGTVERTEQRVLSVVAIGERGCHQWAHAHGERRKSRRLGRRGLHVADAVLAGAVHVHGARAVRWEGLC